MDNDPLGMWTLQEARSPLSMPQEAQDQAGVYWDEMTHDVTIETGSTCKNIGSRVEVHKTQYRWTCKTCNMTGKWKTREWQAEQGKIMHVRRHRFGQQKEITRFQELKVLINKNRIRKSRISSNDYGELLVRRTKRGVKVIAMTNPETTRTGRRTGATYAVVDLDDDATDRPIRRLQAIRGGKRML